MKQHNNFKSQRECFLIRFVSLKLWSFNVRCICNWATKIFRWETHKKNLFYKFYLISLVHCSMLLKFYPAQLQISKIHGQYGMSGVSVISTPFRMIRFDVKNSANWKFIQKKNFFFLYWKILFLFMLCTNVEKFPKFDSRVRLYSPYLTTEPKSMF